MDLNSGKYVFLLIWFSVSFITSVLLFGKGLLLNRDVLPYRAKCLANVSNVCHRGDGVSDLNKCLNSINMSTEQYCSSSDFKVVLIIIDALRYDFTLYNSDITDIPYKNKLSVIHEMLQMYPNKTRLYKFIADPPTTTMQRINGLTTGSLPTFIDIGSNFASSEINEDNIIDQILSNNESVVFMGDDTWVKIYPNRFIRSYPYDSFNVWDLDTVDKGVKFHLFPELQKTDWKFLIAHFLGVDHCGHRYGMNHPEMARKLGEMNDVLRDVVKELQRRNDTMLFVIGDHGMTATGDHGGETEEEISSALFAYSPLYELTTFEEELVQEDDTVTRRQVDLVPTLSSILGVAVPFSNTGSYILDCLPVTLTNSPFRLAPLLLGNIEQLMNYVKEYSSSKSKNLNDQFAGSESLLNDYTDLKKNLSRAISRRQNIDRQSILTRYRNYVRTISETTQRAWIRFDNWSIFLGLGFSCSVLIFSFLVSTSSLLLSAETFDKIFTVGRVIVFCLVLPLLALIVSYMLYACSVITAYRRLELTFYFFVVFFYVVFLCGVIFKILLLSPSLPNLLRYYYVRYRLFTRSTFVAFCYILSSAALLSNSFVESESNVTRFLFTSCLLATVIGHFKCDLLKKPTLNTTIDLSTRYWISYFLSFNFIRTTRDKIYALSFVVCFFTRFIYDTDNEDQLKTTIAVKARCVITVIALNFYLAIVRKFLQYNGNLCGNLFNIIVCSSVPKLNAVLLSIYWLFEILTSDLDRYLFVAEIPKFVLISSLISFVYLSYDTLSVRRDPESRSPPVENSVSFYFSNFIKDQVADSYGCGQYVNGVRGATTVYNALLANLSNLLLTISCVLLGQRYAIAAILMTIALWILIFIATVCRHNPTSSVNADTCEVPWTYVILWGMSCIFWFHSTGHEASFSSIRWNSAFILYKDIGDHVIVPGISVLFNTFCSHIIHTILLPMLLIFRFTVNSFQPNLLSDTKVEGDAALCNELALARSARIFHRGVYFLYMKYLLFFAARLFVMMLSATIHCRHLMMWRIFAPKLIFEAAAFVLVVVPFSMFGYILILRVTKQTRHLLSSTRTDYKNS